MIAKVISKSAFKDIVQDIIQSEKVIGPKKKENKFVFDVLANADELVLDYDVTLRSPKVFFQPPTEKLFNFKQGGKTEIKPSLKHEPFILIGVHTYDLKALNQMDKIWADGNTDEHYLAGRRAATIIAMEPVRASKWSFWAAMEAATVDVGFDILITDIGGKYVLETGSKKGGDFLAKYAKESVTDASALDLKAREEARKKLPALCGKDRRLKCGAGEVTTLLRKSYKHPIWEEKAKKCYSCGSCNLVCPTCYCFDVTDELDLSLESGKRERRWDGCLLEEFAAVGSGENFREHNADRFRHRIFRKTVYIPDKLGELACVGCGRCSEACLPNITDPVLIINKIAEENQL